VATPAPLAARAAWMSLLKSGRGLAPVNARECGPWLAFMAHYADFQ